MKKIWKKAGGTRQKNSGRVGVPEGEEERRAGGSRCSKEGLSWWLLVADTSERMNRRRGKELADKGKGINPSDTEKGRGKRAQGGKREGGKERDQRSCPESGPRARGKERNANRESTVNS